MNPRFVYSMDRETWTGDFSTRDTAAAAGLAVAHRSDSVPTVFVGQMLRPNLHAYGHARSVIEVMSRKVRDDLGDRAGQFLKRLPEKQVMELDRELENTISKWVEKSQLMPAGGKVESISEHAVQTPHAIHRDGSSMEVHDIGSD